MTGLDSGLPPISPDILRVEYRQVLGGNLLDKPTFGERFKMALAKFGSFFGRIAGAVLPFFGPLGMVGSAAAYGLQRFSQGAVDRMQAKRAYNAQLDSQAASMGGGAFWAPGFSNLAMAGGAPMDSSIQVAPFARGYEQGIENTLNNKSSAALNSINGTQAGSTL